MADVFENLEQELNDAEFAKGYGSEVAKNNIGMTLFKIRKCLGLTQKQLSKMLGISQPYIAKLESGEANPTIGAAGELMAILGFILVTDAAPIKPVPSIIRKPSVVSGEKSYSYTHAGSFAIQPGTAETVSQSVQLPKEQEKLCYSSSQCYVIGGSAG